jgi:O-antigen ligase
MDIAAPTTRRSSAAPAILVGASLGIVAVGVVSGVSTIGTTALALLVTLAALTRTTTASWPRLLAVLILVILLIPIRRYALPGDLPFQLELYRLFVAFLVLGWFASLLVDPKVRPRRTGFEGPILLILGGAVASVIANPERVAQYSSEVEKSLMFFLSFVLVLYVTASAIQRIDNVDYLAKTLVIGGAIVAICAVFEARTGTNVFNHLSRVMPFLRDMGDVGGYQRAGTAKMRVFASAQHPIALSAALVMLSPLALYLYRRYRQRRWLFCAGALAAACAATISRTGVIMFLVVGAVFLWLRPKEVRRLWPMLLVVPVAIHFVLPGTLGAVKQSFMPAGGLVSEQHASANTAGSGRLADLGPGLDLWQRQPLLGQGYGTQVVNMNAGGVESNILDDQWLGTLIGTGVVGFFGWLWFFVRAIRRFGAEAKRDQSERGWLLAAIAASVAAYAVGMVTFDAFAFIQVTFLMFIFVGLGAALLAQRPMPHPVATPANRESWSSRRALSIDSA